MNLRTTGRVAIAGLAILSALTMTACSDDSSTTTHRKHRATTSAGSAAAPPGLTVADLNAKLQKALDPKVPNSEKLTMVQGMSADPSLTQKMATAQAQNKASIKIKSVSQTDTDQALALADVSVNGGKTNEAQVPFVYDNGEWKIEHTWACGLLKIAKVTSAACPGQ